MKIWWRGKNQASLVVEGSDRVNPNIAGGTDLKRFMPVTVLCAAAISIVACGSGEQRARTPGGATGQTSHPIPVTLGGFFIHSRSISPPARKENLLVRNVGDEKHELVVVRTRDQPNRLPMRGDRVDEQEAGKNYGEADDLAPGHQRSLTLSLPPGRYVMFCNLPGHYHKGMHAEITIT